MRKANLGVCLKIRIITPVSGEYYKIYRQDLGKTTPNSQKWPPKMTPQIWPKKWPSKMTLQKDPPWFMHTKLKTVLKSKSSDIWSEWKLNFCLQNWCDSPNKFQMWISQLLEEIVHKKILWKVGQSLSFTNFEPFSRNFAKMSKKWVNHIIAKPGTHCGQYS